jgi:hypothetical protein
MRKDSYSKEEESLFHLFFFDCLTKSPVCCSCVKCKLRNLFAILSVVEIETIIFFRLNENAFREPAIFNVAFPIRVVVLCLMFEKATQPSSKLHDLLSFFDCRSNAKLHTKTVLTNVENQYGTWLPRGFMCCSYFQLLT